MFIPSVSSTFFNFYATEDRDYDFGQSFDFELNPNKVKATFNNGVLDVTIHKITPTKGKIIKIE